MSAGKKWKVMDLTLGPAMCSSSWFKISQNNRCQNEYTESVRIDSDKRVYDWKQ